MRHGSTYDGIFVPNNFSQRVAISKKFQPRMHAWRKLGQHVHIAMVRVEIVPQHRPKQAQLANPTLATKCGDPLLVQFDRQLGSAHVLCRQSPRLAIGHSAALSEGRRGHAGRLLGLRVSSKAGGWALDGLQFADMSDVALGDGADLRRQKCDDRESFAGECHELNFVARARLMDVDDGADIACLQAIIGQVLSQDGAVVFFDHDFASKG